MKGLDYLRELNLCSMCLRILLAMFVGGFLGLDREQKHRPAGFRTYMLVAVGAAATVILSQYLDLMLSTRWREAYEILGNRTDVVRLGAQVISGIGFIGTGTILITERKEVTGLTTACCLWGAACTGLACGAGFYEGVLISFLLIFGSLRLLPPLEAAVLAKSRHMNIFVDLDSVEDLSHVVEHMKAQGIRFYDVEMGKQEKAGVSYVTGLFSVKLPQRRDHTELLAALSALPGVAAIEEV